MGQDAEQTLTLEQFLRRRRLDQGCAHELNLSCMSVSARGERECQG